MATTAKLLIIGHNWPEPATTACGCRMVQLIRCLRQASYQVCFASTAARSPYSIDLEEEGVQTENIQLNDPAFEEWLANWRPDVVLFDRFMTEEQFGWKVASVCPKAIRILDTEDLHSLRACRKDAFGSGKEFSPAAWRQHPLTIRELASIYRSDLSLVISSFEFDFLQQVAGIPDYLLCHLPFMYPVSDSGALPSFEEREGFICLGNGRHHPNVDAVRWLKNELWPGIRQRIPAARLDVYGAYLTKELRDFHNPDMGFHIRGWAPDVERVMRMSRVQLAPLRYGAGIKGKLATSMRCGTPSVTTPIGAEGMHADLPWGGIVTGDSDDFVAAAIDLYTTEEHWQLARDRGLYIIDQLYGEEPLRQRLLERLLQLTDNREAYRSQNLIGAMLMHHRMASTKYLGKWIEAKRKLLDS